MAGWMEGQLKGLNGLSNSRREATSAWRSSTVPWPTLIRIQEAPTAVVPVLIRVRSWTSESWSCDLLYIVFIYCINTSLSAPSLSHLPKKRETYWFKTMRPKIWATPGIEPGTSRTRSGNHATRPSGHSYESSRTTSLRKRSERSQIGSSEMSEKEKVF